MADKYRDKLVSKVIAAEVEGLGNATSENSVFGHC